MRATSHYDNNQSIRVPRKKKDRTGVRRKKLGKEMIKHHSNQNYCVLFKKAGMSEQKYMLHISEDYFGKCSKQKYIKDGLGGPLGSSNYAVKQYKKYKNKRMKDMKDIREKKEYL